MRASRMRKLGVWVIMIGLWSIACFAAVMSGGFAEWVLTYTFAGLIIYAGIVQWASLNVIELSRSVERDRYLAGESIEVTVKFKIRSSLPLLWLIVEDCWIKQGESEHRSYRKLLYPGRQRTFEIQYQLESLERGKYIFQGLQAVSGDVFGLILKKTQAPLVSEILVYPRLGQAVYPGASHCSIDGQRIAMPLRHTDEYDVAGVRDYVPGDPFKQIHWKSAAKYQQLKTKEVEYKDTLSFTVCLDVSKSIEDSFEDKALFEYRVRTAASLLKFGDDTQYRIGLALNDTYEQHLYSAGGPYLQSALELLAAVQPVNGSDLGSVMERLSVKLPSGAILMGVTTTLSQSLLRSLQRLSLQGRSVSIVYVQASPVLSIHARSFRDEALRVGCSFQVLKCKVHGRKEGTDQDVIA